MKKKGPIVIIDDDIDDLDIFLMAFGNLNIDNEIVTFIDSTKAIEYLERPDTLPFIILSDINMPKLNGYELRDKIIADNNLHIKCVPFIYFTTSEDPKVIYEAYCKSVQGFFVKGNDIKKLEIRLRLIVDYWTEAMTPSNI